MTRALQRKIHVACRELGLDNDARRDLQFAATGKASMREMSEAELKLVFKRLEASGFTASKTTKRKHKPAPRADLRLVHVLWSKLGEAGALERPGRDGLNAFLRSQFEGKWQSVPMDIDMLRDHGKIDDVLQALMSWGKRAKIDFDWEAIGKGGRG